MKSASVCFTHKNIKVFKIYIAKAMLFMWWYDLAYIFQDVFTDICGTELVAFARDVSPNDSTEFQSILPGPTCGKLTRDRDESG